MSARRGKEQIRDALEQVQLLRVQQSKMPEIQVALSLVKAFQCRRFEAMYEDLLSSQTYGPACRFFLKELYGPADFSQRDAEFSKIAGAVERLFPKSIVEIAVAIADLHALTEGLDMGMAISLSSYFDHLQEAIFIDEGLYKRAWRDVGRFNDRKSQLERVILLGSMLGRITKLPGITLTLRAMRRPAAAANLSMLQLFLEEGLSTFANMAREKQALETFLETINNRESKWMGGLQ